MAGIVPDGIGRHGERCEKTGPRILMHTIRAAGFADCLPELRDRGLSIASRGLAPDDDCTRMGVFIVDPFPQARIGIAELSPQPGAKRSVAIRQGLVGPPTLIGAKAQHRTRAARLSRKRTSHGGPWEWRIVCAADAERRGEQEQPACEPACEPTCEPTCGHPRPAILPQPTRLGSSCAGFPGRLAPKGPPGGTAKSARHFVPATCGDDAVLTHRSLARCHGERTTLIPSGPFRVIQGTVGPRHQLGRRERHLITRARRTDADGDDTERTAEVLDA